MNRGIFIQSDEQQYVGAKIAKFALETHGKAREHGIPVTIIEVEKVKAFQDFVGKPYRKGYAPFTFDDLQSFTMTRFMPPELMGYQGRALVIDPDIFALTDIAPLIEMDLESSAIAACRRRDVWDTSVMVLECSKLTHWKIEEMLHDIATGKRVYEDTSSLADETAPVSELSRNWNSLDHLDSNTKMLHTTVRLTQPWKTGLPIDFTQNPMPKYFGLIPREPIKKLLGTYPTHYQPHPDPAIEKFFFDLAREALEAGAITKTDVERDIEAGNLRKDFIERIG